MKIIDQIKEELNNFSPTYLNVIDESSLHAGKKVETHFRVEIISEVFKEKTLLSRHRLVNTCLKNIMPNIHALSIFARAPNESKDFPPSAPCSGN